MGRTKQRGNGEGSVVTIRRDGKIVGYAAEITVGWKSGRRQKKRGELRLTRSEALRDVETLKRLHSNGVDLTAKPQTLGPFLRAWLDETFDGRPKSVETYGWAIEQVIIPELGDVPLAKLSAQRIDHFLSALQRGERALAPKSAALVRTVLRQAYDQAVRWRLVDANPVLLTRKPKTPQSAGKALTLEQARALLAAAQGERLEVALRLTLALGLRRGETCGLRWSDIDVAAGTITIRRTLTYLKPKGKQPGQLAVGDPKTVSGQRTVKLPPSLLQALHTLRAEQQREIAAVGHTWASYDAAAGYLFLASTHGGALNPGVLRDVFKRVAARAGLDARQYRLHDLRHSCATILHAEGADLKKISMYLGHANIQVTANIYTHLFPGALNDAAATIERALAGDRGENKSGDKGKVGGEDTGDAGGASEL